MEPLVREHLQELREICSRYRVQRLEIFGSAVLGTFDPSASDLDFLVDFEPSSRGELVDRYFGLMEALEQLFGRPVDLVMTAAVENPFFLQAIERSRTLLYAA